MAPSSPHRHPRASVVDRMGGPRRPGGRVRMHRTRRTDAAPAPSPPRACDGTVVELRRCGRARSSWPAWLATVRRRDGAGTPAARSRDAARRPPARTPRLLDRARLLDRPASRTADAALRDRPLGRAGGCGWSSSTSAGEVYTRHGAAQPGRGLPGRAAWLSPEPAARAGPRRRRTARAPSSAPAASETRPCRSSLASASSSVRPSCSSTESRSWRRHSCGSSASGRASASASARALAGRDHPVDQAHPLGLPRVDRAAGEDQVHRPAGADQPRQPDGAAVDQRHAPAPAEDAEHRVAAGHPQVAPERELEAAGDGVPLDRGDHRLRQPHPGRAHRAVAVLGDLVAALGADRLEVGAGAEGAAVAVQHRDALARRRRRTRGTRRPAPPRSGRRRRCAPRAGRSTTVVTGPSTSTRTLTTLHLGRAGGGAAARAPGSTAGSARPRTPTTCPRSAWSALAGMPATTMPPGSSVPGVTTEPAATSVRGADGRAVEERRAVADQRLLADLGAVHDAAVADGGVAADHQGLAGRGVQDRVVLHVGALADHDRADVGAQHGAVPDAGALLDGHVADQGRGRGDEGVGVDGGALALELEQWHGGHSDHRRRIGGSRRGGTVHRQLGSSGEVRRVSSLHRRDAGPGAARPRPDGSGVAGGRERGR